MGVKDKKISVGEILRLISERTELVTFQFHKARADEDEKTSIAMAEAKWQLAELKLKIIDKVLEGELE